MAIEAGDFKTGLTVLVDGDPWVVLDFLHVKPGKGAAILKTKMKNLKTGATQERNFNASTKFDAAEVLKKKASYSYKDGTTYYFMDTDTYDQYELDEQHLDFNKYFLVDGMEVLIIFFQGQVLDVQVPEKVELVVTETTPAIKGANTTQTKDAVCETGLKIRVPMFIEEGEKIVVFTADGKYSGRA